jgi:hypothetical protein
MIMSESIPFRIGFYLERAGVRFSQWPKLPYLGIDRLPYVPSPEEEERIRVSGNRALADLWVHYWDLKNGRELMMNPDIAQELRQRFLTKGIELDLVNAEIIMTPQDFLGEHPLKDHWSKQLAEVVSHWQIIHDKLPACQSHGKFLGFDLSYPVPSFHSAIFQPGLHKRRPDLPCYLNSNGLFDDLKTASCFLRDSLELNYSLVFCVLGIWQT